MSGSARPARPHRRWLWLALQLLVFALVCGVYVIVVTRGRIVDWIGG